MKQWQMAVVSANSTVARFFELELRLLSCSVRNHTKMPPHTETYDCVFVDADTVRHYVSCGTRVVTVSQMHSFDPKGGHLPWPTSLEEIRLLFEHWEGRTLNAREDKANGDENILWIQNRERREIRYKNQIVTLSASEFLLLTSLSNEEKKPVDRETLLGLFGTDEGNIADVYVCHLRKKLEQLCERRVIDTVRGVGYRLNFSLCDAETE